MKKILILFALIPFFVFSQSKIVTGTVNDENNLPLVGVNITVDNSNIGALTDFDGNYTISIPSNLPKKLTFSYLGYTTQEIDVSGTDNMSIMMIPDLTQLEEVVVVGYGSVLKKDLTGALSTVEVEDEVANQSNSIDQLLQGRAAGVQVVQNAATPGAGISVKIRGTNSLRGNNEPLYVVDGVIISSAGEDVLPAGVGNLGQESQNGLAGINPRDIESIQVLKDASATAIYGSRGANGVVVITTKKGMEGKVKIEGFSNSSVRMITKKYNVLDPYGFAEYANEVNANNGLGPRYFVDGLDIYGVESTGVVAGTPAQLFHWQDEVYTEGISTKVGASASGGTDGGNYYISAGFDNQEGVVPTSSFKSGDMRINFNQDLNDKLRLEARMSAYLSSTNFAEGGDLIGSANQSFIKNLISFRPIITEEFEDFGEDLDISNPYSWINDFKDISKESRYIANLALTYKLPIQGLRYQIKVGGNIREKERRRFFGTTTWQGNNANGSLQITGLNNSSFQVNNFLRFNRTFKRKHRINSVLGVTYDVRNVLNNIYAVEDFVTTQFTTENPAFGQVTTQPLTFIKGDQQIFSILGRFNYAWDNQLIMTATFRRDGVSKFAQNNKYGFFPSVALAWQVDQSGLLDNTPLDELKIRMGWGQIGNHGIGSYGTLSNYGVSSNLYGNASGGTNVPIALQNVANPDLTWETTEQLNSGFDFVSTNDFVSGSLDIYTKTTKDLLQRSNIPTSSGFQSILVNKGEIKNTGVELALDFNIISKEDFNFSVGGNIAWNKTEITNLESQALEDFYVDGIAEPRRFYFGDNISRGNIFKYPANVFVEGEETSMFYGLETDGIYQSDDVLPEVFGSAAVPGDVKIVDQNGDGIIDLKDRTFIGNPNPDYVYGFNLNFNYKRFNARVLFNGVYGNDIANGNLLQLDNAEGLIYLNISPDAYYNAWRPDAETNVYPRIGYTTNGQPAMTDRIIEDGSYLRLSNLTISYDFDVDKIRSISNLKMFVAGQNLFTLTDYSGYDPEISSFLYNGLINGVDWNGRANARTFVLGLNIGF
jgi:TonB-linked SusC/RagA family outer membrane protein